MKHPTNETLECKICYQYQSWLYYVIHASVFINDFLKAVYLTDRNLTICFREQYGHNQ